MLNLHKKKFHIKFIVLPHDLGSLSAKRRGGNFDPLTFEWADPGYVLSLTGQTCLNLSVSLKKESNPLVYLLIRAPPNLLYS